MQRRAQALALGVFSLSCLLASLGTPPVIAADAGAGYTGRDTSQRLTFAEGQIVAVDVGTYRITINPYDGPAEVEVILTKDSHLRTRRGRGLAIQDLRAGLEVRVRGIRQPESTADRIVLTANLIIVQEVTSHAALPQAAKRYQNFSGRIDSLREDSITVRGKYRDNPHGAITTESFRLTKTTHVTAAWEGEGPGMLNLVGRLVRVRVDRGTALQVQVRK